MEHVMIDIETLSTSNRGVILAIAAVPFDWTGPAPASEWWVRYLEIDQQMNHLARRVDFSTLTFWLTQSHEAIRDVFRAEGRVTPAIALVHLNDFLRPFPDVRVWAKSPHFDGSMVMDLADQLGIPLAIHYRAWRDVRTFCEGVNPPDIPATGYIEHTPIADCLYQIEHVLRAYAERYSPTALTRTDEPSTEDVGR